MDLPLVKMQKLGISEWKHKLFVLLYLHLLHVESSSYAKEFNFLKTTTYIYVASYNIAFLLPLFFFID